MAEKMPDFQEKLVMHLEGELSDKRPFYHFYRLKPGVGPEVLKDPEHLFLMMAAQEEEGYRPNRPSEDPEMSRRVLGGPTQLSLLINGGNSSPEVKNALLAVIQSVRRAGGWTFAYGGRRIEGAAAHAFLNIRKSGRFFTPNSVLKLGVPENAAGLEGGRSCTELVGDIRKLVTRAATPRFRPLAEAHLYKAFGDDLSGRPGDFVELNAHWLKRYGMATEAGPKNNLLTRFLRETGVLPTCLRGIALGRFFEENL